MIDLFKVERKSRMHLGEVYFWTTTIHHWLKLLEPDTFKIFVAECLKYLSEERKIKIYGFVVMPNHVHLIWEMLEMNGKEMPYASFQKFTAHQFLIKLREGNKGLLKRFAVNDSERNFRFWQRDPLAIKILSKEMCEQKLDYIHCNPLQEHWQLTDDPANYHFSSCSFYERASKDFEFLTDYRERFGS